jgi:hydrogenase maturation protease
VNRKRILVAGIGNIFLGDDGFGVEVANRLLNEKLPEDVAVRDFGIRGLHLAFEMLDGAYEATLLVDAVPRGGAPGSLYLIEPDLTNLEATPADAHSMDPAAVLATVKALGGMPKRVLVVGCEPASVEDRMGLSPQVAGAVDEAVHFVLEVIDRELVVANAQGV